MTTEEYVKAVKLHQQGKLEDAECGYREVLRKDDGHVGAWHLLGVLLHQLGDHDAAIAHITTAINLGNQQAGCFNNLGAVYLTLEDLDHAEPLFRQAVAIKADYADGHTNLGHVAFRRGDLSAATAAFQKAIELDPAHTAALCGQGRLLLEQGQPQAALDCLQRAVAANPNDALAWKTTGLVFISVQRPDEALVALRRALNLATDNAEIQFSLGTTLDELGAYEEGAKWRLAALSAMPKRHWWQLRHVLSCPAVALSRHEIAMFETRLHATLDAFAARKPPGKLDELVANDILLPYALHGLGLDERAIRSKFATLFMPYLPTFDPYVNREGLPHLGVLVTSGHEGIFCRLALPIINRLSAAKLRVTIACSAHSWETIRRFGVADHVEHVAFPLRPSLAAEVLRGQRFDVLYHWEPGTDPLNYFLAMLRLAPLQCTGYGLQATSGIPTIDEYISSELIEVPGADGHYTERLVRLPSLLTYQVRDERAQPDRARFGFSEQSHIYLCVQNPIKVHPGMDEAIGDILRRDPAGLVVMPERKQATSATRFKRRFQESIPDVADRVTFLPPQSGEAYRTLLATADVHLDTFPYGASTTAYDIFSQNGPLVTMPNDFQRSRYALGCYRKMGLLDLVAQSADQYVDIAVRLANDREWNAKISSRLSEATEVLFGDQMAIDAYEMYFVEAAERARKGETVGNRSAVKSQF